MQNKLKYTPFFKGLIKAYTVGLFFCNISHANNTSYIALSNHIARKSQLQVSANNVANINTIGYEADNVVFKNIDLKQNSARNNSFVYAEGTYKNELKGPLKMTYRPLDIAIAGEGYFKVITPRGYRYTKNGAIFINNQNVLVNMEGLPFVNRNDQEIVIPIDTKDIRVAEDATIFADGEENEVIGIFSFPDSNVLVKEGNNLYSSTVRDILLDEYTIISGALRGSNVNSTKSMAEMVELQRSAAMTNNLMSNVADLEKSVITKVAK